MSRLFLFLLGVSVGAVGLYFLSIQGLRRDLTAPARAPVAVVEPATNTAPAAPISAPTDLTPAPALIEAPAVAPVAVEPIEAAVAYPPADASEAPQPSASTTDSGPAANGSRLLIPVAGVRAEQLTDTYTQSRGEGRSHDAIDIMAARGTPVFAVDDGRVAKLFTSQPGGLTVYQFDRSEKLAYYYAHLDSYAPGVTEGQLLKRGDPVGFVGSTGNANPASPHLHFAIFQLGPEKRWWKGTAINPFPLLGGHPPPAAAAPRAATVKH